MDPLGPDVSAAAPAGGVVVSTPRGVVVPGPGAGRSASRFIAWLAALVLFAAFAAFVWPTQWRYDKMTIGDDTYPVRIHRVTGHADVLLPGDGWTPAEDVTTDSNDQDQQPGNKT
jgi:hypothetical protein